jgi:hypothetical protein
VVFSCNVINVIFLIKKLHLCHSKGHRCNFFNYIYAIAGEH